MSMQAQAERERQARIILGDSDVRWPRNSRSGAQLTPTTHALPPRAMNMLYEGSREFDDRHRAFDAVASMNLGGLAGMTSLGLQVTKPREHTAVVAAGPPRAWAA
jgi:hypothetical protein